MRPNTPEYNQEMERRLLAYYEKKNEKSIRDAEKEMKASRKGKRGDGTTFAKRRA